MGCRWRFHSLFKLRFVVSDIQFQK
jgi:hypothetical protein